MEDQSKEVVKNMFRSMYKNMEDLEIHLMQLDKKENMEDHIIDNKPCLSKQEVLSMLRDSNIYANERFNSMIEEKISEKIRNE